MAKVRIGFSTQFEVENEKVGIGTDSALATLHATGDIIAHNIDAGGGITTVTTYDGFIDKEVKLTNPDINLNSQSHALSGEIIIDNEITVSSGTTFTSGPENLTVTDNFTLPNISDDRPTAGTMRFNENLAALEFYTGVEWKPVNSHIDIDGGGSRCIIAGGFGDTTDPGSPQGQRKEIQYFNTATQGNSQYFGDLTDYALPDDGAGNSTRCLIAHQVLSGIEDHIDYFAMSTQGNGVDFGNLFQYRFRAASVSSSTRALWCGGKTPSTVDTIDYVEIMTTGNALEFGDTMVPVTAPASAMSPTRGIIANGIVSPTSPHYTSEMSFLTIASKGNSVRFGENTFNGGYNDGCSNNTRALFAGGYDQSNTRNQQRISAVTIASEGNAIDFGDLHIGKAFHWGAGTQTRGFFGGGNAFPSQTHYNIIEYVSMNSGGQALDFGEMVIRAYAAGAITNAHGGLGGV